MARALILLSQIEFILGFVQITKNSLRGQIKNIPQDANFLQAGAFTFLSKTFHLSRVDLKFYKQISYRLFNGSHFVTQTNELSSPENYEYEVWAYPAGISQTYDFWPDAVVAGDPEMLETVRKANNEFKHLAAEKIAGFTKNVKRKTGFWSVYSNDLPAEPVK